MPRRKHHVPFFALTYRCRAMFIALLLPLMALLTYYHLLHTDNALELFMDSQTFGVKFLFAAVGGVIALFWASFFTSVATAAPFLTLSSQRQLEPSDDSRSAIFFTPPTNAFSGVWTAARQRNLLLLLAGLISAIAELLLPVLLSNIPYTLTQTLTMHKLCTYLGLAIMGGMVLVLVGSMLFVRWPYMPIDPRTLAGRAYYVADSEMLRRDVMAAVAGSDWEGRRSEDEDGKELKRYFYGSIVGPGGRARMAVDCGG
ncbi:hypothetical protein B0H67DRAFT_566481 [Lasiosphaeris hirsuta]|uniref:Uncharacterized protein n=1 Tax=Lasiosphaeris hirsuta TaxID=260670 RepID=A0AA40E8D3_9PEZI|nr:hypothetical protein B0H67DRAFT_566481 [Lasiosphaeris hirsuta]